MKQNLSILIPTYNDPCATLVEELQRQAAVLGIAYEIIVGDDGSTDHQVLETNRGIQRLPNCRLLATGRNQGRAAIRNTLAQQAQYDWLLFIDSDMTICRNDYLLSYMKTEGEVIYGGIVVGAAIPGNLRSLWEKASEHQHTVEQRRKKPYFDFHTANFLIRRDLMLAHPFDLRYRHYGYEDVAFGKQLQQEAIPIVHIDNPLSFEVFESNADFIKKTEEGLRTLHQFRDELQDYSRMLQFTRRHAWLLPLFHLLYIWAGPVAQRHLTGHHPTLAVFTLYRLGYFAHLR